MMKIIKWVDIMTTLILHTHCFKFLEARGYLRHALLHLNLTDHLIIYRY